MLAFNEKHADKSVRATRVPSDTMVERLARELWEFGERVRIETLNRQERTRRSRA